MVTRGASNRGTWSVAGGPPSRLVKDGGWTTVITTTGHVEWIPPPLLDTGQARTNLYHHPEHILGDG
mgnify:CR=1 FL=1